MKLVTKTITRRSKNGAALIREALEHGIQVMAKSPNGIWFSVNVFHSELLDDTHPEWGEVWYATPFNRGPLSARQVKTFTWTIKQ